MPRVRNFVAYHSADKMGYSLEGRTEGRALTNKPLALKTVGQRVWRVMGQGGSPKQFFLWGCFEVASVAAGTEGFRFEMTGPATVLEPMFLLNPHPVFDPLWLHLAKNHWSFSEIKDLDLVRDLESCLR